jgi:hypothetical protein
MDAFIGLQVRLHTHDNHILEGRVQHLDPYSQTLHLVNVLRSDENGVGRGREGVRLFEERCQVHGSKIKNLAIVEEMDKMQDNRLNMQSLGTASQVNHSVATQKPQKQPEAQHGRHKYGERMQQQQKYQQQQYNEQQQQQQQQKKTYITGTGGVYPQHHQKGYPYPTPPSLQATSSQPARHSYTQSHPSHTHKRQSQSHTSSRTPNDLPSDPAIVAISSTTNPEQQRVGPRQGYETDEEDNCDELDEDDLFGTVAGGTHASLNTRQRNQSNGQWNDTSGYSSGQGNRRSRRLSARQNKHQGNYRPLHAPGPHPTVTDSATVSPQS